MISKNLDSEYILRRRVSQQVQELSYLKVPQHLESKTLFEKINWLNVLIVFGVPLMSLWGLFSTKTHYWQTWVWFIVFYFWTGLGVTAGYHRYWAHRSYEASYPLRLFLMIGSSGALQGSIKWWCLLHRAHHRYTDTNDDPYNAQRGFFYSHCGWLLYNQIRVKKNISINDLRADPIVRWQHTNFYWFGPFMAYIFPCLVAGLFWGDFRGGFYIAGFCRLLLVHHATWCVNSVAHFFGEFTFDNTISPRDSIITGLLTMGEGYHNFHHEFPQDYRNGIHYYDYDPTKWFIWALSQIGLSYDLVQFPNNEIKRGELDMKQFVLDQSKSIINYGVPIENLPEWNQKKVDTEMKNGRVLIVVFGIIHDVTEFVQKGKHPGGKKIILERNGKDATVDYDGGIYNHTNASRNLLSHMRIAKFVPK